ncbi:hypothetical protein D9M68_834920 [compost metagenome]
MRDVALEVPLGAFAVVRRGQGGHPADARVEALGDALDDATLAGGIAALEENHQLVAALHHPALQLHQLALETEQLAEVIAACSLLGAVGDVLVEEFVEVFGVLGQFQLELFVAVVDQLAVDALDQVVIGQDHGLSRERLCLGC